MKCPHCHVHIIPIIKSISLEDNAEYSWYINYYKCTNDSCKKFFLELVKVTLSPANPTKEKLMIYPRTTNRDMAPPEVPKEFAEDFNEAAMILDDSPKASAALSRRCLQKLLREKANVKPGKLIDEIQEIIDRKELPSYLTENLDNIRIIGNFAAHPIKSERTGEIIDVELSEAEWTLDVLEGLFDFYFVLPEKMRKKKEALDKKIASIKKPQEK